jgi:hypothetical protein
LVYFHPELTPPECFDTLKVDMNTLIQQLEEKMQEAIAIPETV